MSKYNIRLNSGNQKIIQAVRKPTVNLDVSSSTEANTISSLQDVDSTDRKEGYVLIWNQTRSLHEYVPPFEVVDRSDSDDPVQPADDAIDYGTY